MGGKFAFTALETVSHRICFRSTASVQRRIELIVKTGFGAKDYSNAAKTEHLKPMQVELRRLEDLVKEIHAEQLYMRQREEELRDTNESTNSRVKWFSIGTIFILSSLGLYQINYL